MTFRSALALGALGSCLFMSAGASSETMAAGVTARPPAISPAKDVIGFAIGDDYQMADYGQLETLWKKWAQQSSRMKLVEIGKTAEGRTQYMAIISSPANLRQLERYRQIARRLALAEGLTDSEAQALAAEGKAVVWIDGGLHASESEGSQQIIETVYQMLSRTDRETMRLLEDTILLAVPANPDGQDIMAKWYMRQADPSRRTFLGVPTMYHHYAGHDNNRDFIMDNMPESQNIARQLYQEWFPQIVYNHHQPGPAGAVVFVPPFRDPFNYYFHPAVPLGIEAVGTAMQQRLASRGMGGAATRTGAMYSTWWNGGLRTAPYFHNQIGLLTEIIGTPTPMEIPFSPTKQLPNGDLPLPVQPGTWHYRQSIDYDIELNWAVLDYASRNRESLLYQSYEMGRDAIAAGSRDSWTVTPRSLERAIAASRRRDPKLEVDSTPDVMTAMGNSTELPAGLYPSVLHDPAYRDPRGYILPADQPDMPTMVRFLNALIRNGIAVSKATSAFSAGGHSYPAGSYVVSTAQAFRPEVLDMFEPQDYPNDFLFPGGPPKPPYDMTGWTLAMQMGVHYDRMLDPFTGPFARVEGLQSPPPQAILGPASPAGYLVSHQSNSSFLLINRLLKAGQPVYWMAEEQAGQSMGTGAIWVPASAEAARILADSARELGVGARGLAGQPEGPALRIRPVRIGLVDLYGGMMPAGWTRWLLEQYEFPYEVVYPQQIDAGNLNAKFDVILLPDSIFGTGNRFAAGGMKMPPVGYALSGTGLLHYEPRAEDIPEQYRPRLGSITAENSLPRLQEFVRQGGTLIAEGSSSNLGPLFGLPVTDHLTEMDADGRARHLTGKKFYIPGSLLRLNIDNHNPLAYGMPAQIALYYDNNPVFRLAPDAAASLTHAVGWFSGAHPELSGWTWGSAYLEGGVPFTISHVQSGKVILLGTDVTFRAQPAATFKLLFNGLLLGQADRVPAVSSQ